MAEDPNFTKMSPEYKKRFREMIKKHEEEEKKLKILYDKSNHGGKK